MVLTNQIESLLIEKVLTNNDNKNFTTISAYRQYEIFWVCNPYASSEQSWYNITSKIGNNKFTISNGTNTKDIFLPDGWYADENEFNLIIQALVQGFKDIGEDVVINLNPLNNKLQFLSTTATTKRIIFSVPLNSFQESSNWILGYPNIHDMSFITETFSPDSVDLFSDGRFFIMKIQLLQFSSSSYVNEPQTLIVLSNKSVYGSFIEKSDIMFEKNLFVNTNVLNLQFNIVDGKNLPLDFTKPIYLQFQIKCYRREDSKASISGSEINPGLYLNNFAKQN